MTYSSITVNDGTIDTTTERLHTAYAMRFGDDEGGDRSTGDEPARASQLREAFNSPYWPFVLVSTAVSQEGLDFHPYCHIVVHRNLPTNPVTALAIEKSPTGTETVAGGPSARRERITVPPARRETPEAAVVAHPHCARRSAGPRAQLRSPRMFDELESERTPRRLDADPGQLRPAGVVLWMLYAPVRAVRDRLIPRRTCTYPPTTPAGRARTWALQHL